MLKVSNLYKRYGPFEVLKDLNMNVETGDIYGFLGRNGCGKTTTMNIIANILPKDSGGIEFEKENPVIGYLPETPMLFNYMNGYEYLDYIASCCNYSGNKKERIQNVLEITGMTEGAKRRIKGYSRGMNQRLGIAAAIFNNPDLLILDEPTSALDPQGRAEVMEIIKNLAGTGSTIILCTHILSDVERIANRIGIIRDGRMALEGNTEEIRRNFAASAKKIEIITFSPSDVTAKALASVTEGRFMYERNINTFTVPIPEERNEEEYAAAILNALIQVGVTPSSFEIKRKSLEEIYLETIG